VTRSGPVRPASRTTASADRGHFRIRVTAQFVRNLVAISHDLDNLVRSPSPRRGTASMLAGDSRPPSSNLTRELSARRFRPDRGRIIRAEVLNLRRGAESGRAGGESPIASLGACLGSDPLPLSPNLWNSIGINQTNALFRKNPTIPLRSRKKPTRKSRLRLLSARPKFGHRAFPSAPL